MPRPTLDEVMHAVASDDNLGFCTACGEEAYGVEPDAHHYKCESCGMFAVSGAEEILMAGLYCDE